MSARILRNVSSLRRCCSSATKYRSLAHPAYHISDPMAEEMETELKASAMIDAILRSDKDESKTAQLVPVVKKGEDDGDEKKVLAPTRVLLVDHEDSFVHTLANYLRQTGAEVSQKVTC